MNKNKNILFIFVISLVVGIVVSFAYLHSSSNNVSTPNTGVIHIVAAENFYGDIVKQLGGSHVQVVSILSDPNADPHEYESSVQDGVAVAKANIIIENGLEYDTWMDKLLSASPNNKRILLVAGKIASHPLPDNPHVWYGIDNIQTIAGKITDALKKDDAVDAGEFDQNLMIFDKSLQSIQEKISSIKSQFNGTPVGLTETIYLYQTQPEGVNILTPFDFEKAIAEGNDPSADDVATTNDQVTKKLVKVLIYNVQTVTPITTNLQDEAKTNNIPIVPVSETMPNGKQYQSWMMDQLTNLQNALQSAK